jgi:phospholipid/cholesterol/gamma-HCH transport system ATP-binding protein
MSDAPAREVRIGVEELVVGYGEQPVLKDLSFDIHRGDCFVIFGGSGCGKSTLMRCLIGLLRPMEGRVLIGDVSLWDVDERRRAKLMRGNGVMYQGGALWSSMTLAENIALPLEQYTDLTSDQIRELAEYKLALVGLAAYGDYYPAEISGGMRKRAGVARAMALDPEILFFDEPSAGLDPINGRRLDDLLLMLRDSLGTTMVVVTHDLASIFAIGDDAIFLDADSRTALASGHPRRLRDEGPPEVRAFLTRGDVEPPIVGPPGASA